MPTNTLNRTICLNLSSSSVGTVLIGEDGFCFDILSFISRLLLQNIRHVYEASEPTGVLTSSQPSVIRFATIIAILICFQQPLIIQTEVDNESCSIVTQILSATIQLIITCNEGRKQLKKKRILLKVMVVLHCSTLSHPKGRGTGIPT